MKINKNEREEEEENIIKNDQFCSIDSIQAIVESQQKHRYEELTDQFSYESRREIKKIRAKA